MCDTYSSGSNSSTVSVREIRSGRVSVTPIVVAIVKPPKQHNPSR